LASFIVEFRAGSSPAPGTINNKDIGYLVGFIPLANFLSRHRIYLLNLMRHYVYKRLLIATLLVLSACEADPLTSDAPGRALGPDKRISIYTVNYPLQYFVQRIGGDLVDVIFPAPRGIDPASWMPDVDTVAEYQRADVIILNGAGYAGWLRRVSLPDSRRVDTSASFADRLLRVTENVAHAHGPEGEHVHDDLAFTIWLNPELATEQATAIRDALARKLPDAVEMLDANLASLASDLSTLDIELRKMFDRLGGRPLVYSRPIYQYLNQRYGLAGKSVDWELDVEPAEDELYALSGLINVVMLGDTEPLPAIRARLEALGITFVVFDPCAGRPEAGDYLDVMSRNIKALDAAL
jgi:zinc transport system substrate-binding protein